MEIIEEDEKAEQQTQEAEADSGLKIPHNISNERVTNFNVLVNSVNKGGSEVEARDEAVMTQRAETSKAQETAEVLFQKIEEIKKTYDEIVDEGLIVEFPPEIQRDIQFLESLNAQTIEASFEEVIAINEELSRVRERLSVVNTEIDKLNNNHSGLYLGELPESDMEVIEASQKGFSKLRLRLSSNYRETIIREWRRTKHNSEVAQRVKEKRELEEQEKKLEEKANAKKTEVAGLLPPVGVIKRLRIAAESTKKDIEEGEIALSNPAVRVARAIYEKIVKAQENLKLINQRAKLSGIKVEASLIEFGLREIEINTFVQAVQDLAASEISKAIGVTYGKNVDPGKPSSELTFSLTSKEIMEIADTLESMNISELPTFKNKRLSSCNPTEIIARSRERLYLFERADEIFITTTTSAPGALGIIEDAAIHHSIFLKSSRGGTGRGNQFSNSPGGRSKGLDEIFFSLDGCETCYLTDKSGKDRLNLSDLMKKDGGAIFSFNLGEICSSHEWFMQVNSQGRFGTEKAYEEIAINDTGIPIENAYIFIVDEPEVIDYYIKALKEAGRSEEWITEHLITHKEVANPTKLRELIKAEMGKRGALKKGKKYVPKKVGSDIASTFGTEVDTFRLFPIE